MNQPRVLCWAHAQLVAEHELAALHDLGALPQRTVSAQAARRACFDAARYDRLRVLATELARIHGDGGELCVRLGHHVFTGERMLQLMRSV